MDYIPPKYNSVFFKFDNFGYVKPKFNDVDFSFDPRMRDLKSTITGNTFQTDYLKSCDTKVVGYGTGEIQLFRDNCVYGGIRDLHVLIFTSNYIDFGGYLKVNQAGQKDVGLTLKPWYSELSYDIKSSIKSWNRDIQKDLQIYVKQTYTDTTNLYKYLNVFQTSQSNLNNSIKGWSVGNIKDILTAIQASSPGTLDIYSYIKSTIQTSFDLPTNIFKIWQHNTANLLYNLHGWQETNLNETIQALHISDLFSTVRATYIRNISAFLYAIQPVNLNASLMGWATTNLGSSLITTKYGGDLNFSLFSIAPIDLPINLVAKKGISIVKDLGFSMTNFYEKDLHGLLNIMYYKDLNVYLSSSRQIIDLQIKIYPKIIFVRHNINLSFLENRDLACIVNFPCFNSSFRDIGASMVVQYRKDLGASVWGTDGSNIKDLRCSINSYAYVTTNLINIDYINLVPPNSNTTITYKKSNIFSINTLNILGNLVTKGYSDLKTNIIGDYAQKDLGVYIRAYSNRHYTEGNSINNFITLKLNNNEEEFRKYVTLSFSAYANKYYYFSGNQRVYREFREDHWVVFVEGYRSAPENYGFDKIKVMKKYIFSLRNYNSIDEAIRDMIDRVTNLKYSDLNSFINATSGNYDDLSVVIKPCKIFKTTRNLKARIKVGFVSVTKDLNTFINPTLLNLSTDLSCAIEGVNYESSTGDNYLVFNFEGSGDVLPDPNNITFEFLIED